MMGERRTPLGEGLPRVSFVVGRTFPALLEDFMGMKGQPIVQVGRGL